MTPEEITIEISDLQSEIKRHGLRIYALAHGLHTKVRRAPADDTTSIYLTYAHSWTRFSGMVSQGLARTAHAGRILKLLPAKIEAAPPAPPKKKAEQATSLSPVESLISMYGEGAENAGSDTPSEQADS